MILADTNILGTFARIESLDLLFDLFDHDEICVSPEVYAELLRGVHEGRQFLRSAVTLIESGRLKLVVLTASDVVRRLKLPLTLGRGEAESIMLCRRHGAAFLTNDRRARNFCVTEGIEVFDLIDLLRSFWMLRICSKHRVHQLVNEIESKEGLVIKHKDRIFAK